jgi:hypothetical protein
MASKQTDEFLREGMKRYGQAAYVLVAFGKEVEGRLHAVLKTRQNWGSFVPVNAAKPRSTRYWSEYPLLNAKVDGQLRGKELVITISVNWYKSETHYPFYSVFVEPRTLLDNEMSQRRWPQGIEYQEGQLRLVPDPEDFDLERDLGRLLDAFVGCLT